MKQSLSLTLIISLVAFGTFVLLEPQLTKGVTDDTTVSLTVEDEITLVCSSTAALAPNIASVSGGTATSTFLCTIETTDTGGYNLNITKSQKLRIADVANQRFDDIDTATTTWDFPAPGAGNETFGFCVNSAASTTDIVQTFLDNGANACDEPAGSVTAWQCWTGIATTTATTSVAVRSTETPVGGVTIEFGLQAVAGGTNGLTAGNYYTTTTVTAVTN
ncbi:MAG TPA: hypothetical protein VJ378_00425 [Candidatus Paceibacterota bacterium]|nr:hypothetical protein [Candidatus Paceibacterota bacterium]